MLSESDTSRLPGPLRELLASAESEAALDGIDLSRETWQQVAEETPGASWWSSEAAGVDLRKASLAKMSLRRAKLNGADLRHADLSGASLSRIELNDALLEGANLEGADLVGGSLERAVLNGAKMKGALLEETHLQNSSLRFADLAESALEHADLRDADLWGAKLQGAMLHRANLKGATLQEARAMGADFSGCDLRCAVLSQARLQRANLTGADLRGAIMRDTDLAGATLREANLEGLVLTGCDLTNIHLSGAWLEKTKLEQRQLGEAIGEELSGEYEAARQGYLALERNFAELGDPDSSSWAYRRKRRMQKLATRDRSRKASSLRSRARYFGVYLLDQLVEWICDYGESVGRVLATLVIVCIAFAALYGALGGVLATAANGTARVTRHPLDLAVFSLFAMTTSGAPSSGLVPRDAKIQLLTGIQSMLGIALTGLLGFVAGNRIRR